MERRELYSDSFKSAYPLRGDAQAAQLRAQDGRHFCCCFLCYECGEGLCTQQRAVVTVPLSILTAFILGLHACWA